MTYIDYLNTFHRFCKEKYLPGNAKLLYFELLALFNEAHWPESLQVDNLRLMSLVDTRTERVAISARDKLVDAGFIRYRKGKKKSPNTYYLLEYTQQKVSEIDSKYDSISGSDSIAKTGSYIKNKTKDETKPLSDGVGARAGTRADVEEVDGYLQARQLDPMSAFGMTDEIYGNVALLAEAIYKKFTCRRPTEADIANVFLCVRHQEYDEATATWTVTLPQEGKDLLLYAFEQANEVGKPGDWKYINGVLAKLHQRGITSLAAAEDYDYERA